MLKIHLASNCRVNSCRIRVTRIPGAASSRMRTKGQKMWSPQCLSEKQLANYIQGRYPSRSKQNSVHFGWVVHFCGTQARQHHTQTAIAFKPAEFWLTGTEFRFDLIDAFHASRVPSCCCCCTHNEWTTTRRASNQPTTFKGTVPFGKGSTSPVAKCQSACDALNTTLLWTAHWLPWRAQSPFTIHKVSVFFGLKIC